METIRERLLTVLLVALCLPFMVSITYRVIPPVEPILEGVAELRREVMYVMAVSEDEPDDGAAIVVSAAAVGVALDGHRDTSPVEAEAESVGTEIVEAEPEPAIPVPVVTEAEVPETAPDFGQDTDIIATLVFHEAWAGCSERHRELVAAVVVNRVNSDLFPASVYGVVTQDGQYNPAYADADSFYGRTARADSEIWETCREIARRALSGEVDCPENVLYQAEFIQGAIYEIHQTSYSVTYFCYG